jgi:hypothetical protein
MSDSACLGTVQGKLQKWCREEAEEAEEEDWPGYGSSQSAEVVRRRIKIRIRLVAFIELLLLCCTC